jgi:CRP-like cAMP-binding protein
MKECPNTCDVKSCFLCTSCLPDWLPAIASQRKNFQIKKGQKIFSEGDSVTGIYFVYKGTAKIHKRWDKEKELILRFAKSGDIVGHLGLGNDTFYPVSATALEPVTVCYLPMDFFESTLKVNNQFTYILMRFFANQLQESEKRMRNLAHMSVKGRIAQAFIALKTQFGTDQSGLVNINISRQDIASFAGVSYETLFKVSNDFSLGGLINLDGKTVSIRDEAALLKIVEDDNV